MKRLLCCAAASLLLAAVAVSPVSAAFEDEIPTFQSVFGQPPIEESGLWPTSGCAYTFVPPAIEVTETEVLLSGPNYAVPQITRFDRTGNATGTIPLYSWQWGPLPIDTRTSGAVGGGPPPDFPVAVAVGPSGVIHALDYDWAAWMRYAADGTFLGGWGGRAGLQPPFVSPTRICTASDGSCYILDPGLSRIQHFTAAGELLGEWYTPTGPADAYSLPADIAVAGQGGLWLLNAIETFDTDAMAWRLDWRVHRYDTNGTEMFSWPLPDGAEFLPFGRIHADSAGNIWVLGQRWLRRFSPDGQKLGEIYTTARNFTVSPDDLLWLLVPQVADGWPAITPDGGTGLYTLETRDFAGNVLQSVGDPHDLTKRGALVGVDGFVTTPDGDTYVSVENSTLYPEQQQPWYIDHFGPDGTLKEILPATGYPIQNPITGAVELVARPPTLTLGPDGCYYNVAETVVDCGSGEGDPSTWAGHVTVARYHADGGTAGTLTVPFPAGVANGMSVAGYSNLTFGADGNFRVWVQGWSPSPDDYPAVGPIWIATVTPQGSIVNSWRADDPDGFYLERLLVDPAGDVYAAGNGGVLKYTASGRLVGPIGTFGYEGSPHSRLSDVAYLSIDARGTLRVLDGPSHRIYAFAYTPGPFPDVPYWSWSRDPVKAVADSGIVGGYPDGNYHPSERITRDQMAVFIARALSGSEAAIPAGPAQPSFRDVPGSYWAYKYIESLKSQGVVSGYGDGSEYEPAEPVDRAQMAVFLVRALTSDGGALTIYHDSGEFADVPADHWAYQYIRSAYMADLLNGYPDNTYRPDEPVTRDQMAVYIQRAFHPGEHPL